MFYRDGVAENQFNEVIDAEVAAIKGACEDIRAGWNPPLTFVVVQKRHNTRLFPNDNQNQVGGSGSGARRLLAGSAGCCRLPCSAAVACLAVLAVLALCRLLLCAGPVLRPQILAAGVTRSEPRRLLRTCCGG